MVEPSPPKKWWETTPAILSALAALIGAIVGLIAALNQIGVFENKKPTPQPTMPVAIAPSSPGASQPTTPAPSPPPPQHKARFTTLQLPDLPKCSLSGSYCEPNMCWAELQLRICGVNVCPNSACNIPPLGNTYVPLNDSAQISLGEARGQALHFEVRRIPECQITGRYCGPENCTEESQIVFCGVKICPNSSCNIEPFGNSSDIHKRTTVSIPLGAQRDVKPK